MHPHEHAVSHTYATLDRIVDCSLCNVAMHRAKTAPSWRHHSLSDFEITVEYPVRARVGTEDSTGVRAAPPDDDEITLAEGSQADIHLLAQGEITEVSSTPSAVQAYFVPASESLIADAEACVAAFRRAPTTPLTWAQRMVRAAANAPAPPAPVPALSRVATTLRDFGEHLGASLCKMVRRARRWLRCTGLARALRLRRCRSCDGLRSWTSFDVVLPPGMAKRTAASARVRDWQPLIDLAALRSKVPSDRLSVTIASCKSGGHHNTLELTWHRGWLRRLIASDIDISDDDRYTLLSLTRR